MANRFFVFVRKIVLDDELIAFVAVFLLLLLFTAHSYCFLLALP